MYIYEWLYLWLFKWLGYILIVKFRKRSDNKNCIGYEATSEWTSIDEQGLHRSSEYT
jgi:hypothetical protein